ncbi:MAG: NADH-quinone oxidoreductase subunit NuoK [Fibromonadaceae bacterium]|jgi:NADH:ubiquinone oxidoreductase subunit K|nr:NADH-quinone oxidoreductase subunit NuoK [Fibromonadaceae bacterium]
MLSPFYIQILAALLFCLGVATVISKRNIFFAFMGIELAINAANLSFIGFSKSLPSIQSVAGQIAPIFVIAVAAAEACVGLAIVIMIFKNQESIDSDEYSSMQG